MLQKTKSKTYSKKVTFNQTDEKVRESNTVKTGKHGNHDHQGEMMKIIARQGTDKYGAGIGKPYGEVQDDHDHSHSH